jgi:hypothetical protein
LNGGRPKVKSILSNKPHSLAAPPAVLRRYGLYDRFFRFWYRATPTKNGKLMLATEILPEVSVIDAILLFRRLGVDVTGMPSDALREARRQLIHRHTPTGAATSTRPNPLMPPTI